MKEGVTLKEYFDAQIENVKQATELARESMEKRLDGMNEFRDTLKDQAGKFITRQEYEDKHKSLEDRQDRTERLVWVGVGIVATVEILLRFFIK